MTLVTGSRTRKLVWIIDSPTGHVGAAGDAFFDENGVAARLFTPSESVLRAKEYLLSEMPDGIIVYRDHYENSDVNPLLRSSSRQGVPIIVAGARRSDSLGTEIVSGYEGSKDGSVDYSEISKFLRSLVSPEFQGRTVSPLQPADELDYEPVGLDEFYHIARLMTHDWRSARESFARGNIGAALIQLGNTIELGVSSDRYWAELQRLWSNAASSDISLSSEQVDSFLEFETCLIASISPDQPEGVAIALVQVLTEITTLIEIGRQVSDLTRLRQRLHELVGDLYVAHREYVTAGVRSINPSEERLNLLALSIDEAAPSKIGQGIRLFGRGTLVAAGFIASSANAIGTVKGFPPALASIAMGIGAMKAGATGDMSKDRVRTS